MHTVLLALMLSFALSGLGHAETRVPQSVSESALSFDTVVRQAAPDVVDICASRAVTRRICLVLTFPSPTRGSAISPPTSLVYGTPSDGCGPAADRAARANGGSVYDFLSDGRRLQMRLHL